MRGRPWPGRQPSYYCCFGCLSLGEEDAGTLKEDNRELGNLGWRLGVGVLLAGQSMLLSLGVNLSPPEEPLVTRFVQGLILACTLVVLAVLGGPLFRNTLHELRQRRVTVEVLFVLTLAGAMVASLQSFLTGVGPIYFETVSILLVVYTIGKLIGARGRARALARSRLWSAELARCRLVDAPGRCHDVEAATVVPGDVVEVRPGETIAVDGVIESGIGFVCEAARTGEPFSAVRRPGDRVLAGCIVEDTVLLIRATAPGNARHVDHFLEAVEQARSSPTSLQGQADRLARIAAPVMVMVALATFAFWTWSDGWSVGLFNAMSVLLVACPCALGLATPIVLWTALGRLAERGLITRQGDFVERLAAVDRVVFDKTGTLTEDRFALLDLSVLPVLDRGRLLRWLAAVEARSSHPVARAFSGIAPQEEQEKVRLLALRVVSGCGVEADIEEEGERHTLRIGRPEWLGSAERPEAPALLPLLRMTAGHRIDIELDGKFAAVALVAERLRESTHDALDALRSLGLPVEVMTGDTAERAAETLRGPLDNAPAVIVGSVSPEQKQDGLRQRSSAGGWPLFVGDGLNDAGALATAPVGIALASGTDLAVAAAAATLYGGDLRTLPWAISLCRQSIQIARATILWAAFYNVIGMTLAALGLLHPISAALLMTASSLWVAWLSSRVGTVAVACHSPPSPTLRARDFWKPTAHAIGLVLQGFLVCLLLEIAPPHSLGVLLGFLVAGLAVPWLLRRATALSHSLELMIGMLAVGNLGMLGGWWVDNRFGPIPEGCACGCDSLFHEGLSPGVFMTVPGMWVGMFLAGNLAMRFLGRVSCGGWHLILHNVGMVFGMLGGGVWASWAVSALGWPSAVTHLVGMTAGMLLGMAAVCVILTLPLPRGRLRPAPP